MNNLTLIQRLTWAIVEVSVPNGKPNLIEVTNVLQEALCQALIEQERLERLKATVIANAKIMGE